MMKIQGQKIFIWLLIHKNLTFIVDPWWKCSRFFHQAHTVPPFPCFSLHATPNQVSSQISSVITGSRPNFGTVDSFAQRLFIHIYKCIICSSATAVERRQQTEANRFVQPTEPLLQLHLHTLGWTCDPSMSRDCCSGPAVSSYSIANCTKPSISTSCWLFKLFSFLQ